MKKFINRKASHEYFFLNFLETGIVLTGTEIKSIRAGKLNFKDCFARIARNELFLYNLHISPFDKASFFNHEPERPRKLLVHKRELRRLQRQLEEKGLTLVPAELYINDKQLAKIKLAVAKGKKLYDKRVSLQEKDEQRRNDRESKY